MHRTSKTLAVGSLAVILLLTALPMEAAVPARPSPDIWAALWQPIAELLGFTDSGDEADVGLRTAVGAAGVRWDPHGLTQPEPEETEEDVSLSGPAETSEEGVRWDPNG